MELVPSALLEVDYVHDAICLLQEVQGPLILLALNEAIGTVVELGHHDGNLVLAHPQLLVVVLVERIVLIVLALLRLSWWNTAICGGRCRATSG